jgi:hypothetical protein
MLKLITGLIFGMGLRKSIDQTGWSQKLPEAYCSSSLELMLRSLKTVKNVLKIHYLPQESILRAHYKKLTLNTV